LLLRVVSANLPDERKIACGEGKMKCGGLKREKAKERQKIYHRGHRGAAEGTESWETFVRA
jgi:hypothetical protein